MLAVCMAMINSENDSENDRNAFTEHVNKYQNKLLLLARNILNDDMLAEDAVWDAFFNIANSFEKINNLSIQKIEAYLIITTKNASYAVYNKEKSHSQNIAFDDLINENLPSIDDISKYDYDFLIDVISELDDKV